MSAPRVRPTAERPAARSLWRFLKWGGIVLGTFGVAAALVIPRLLEPKVNWNDRAAVGTLRNLCSVQDQFRNGVHVDVDVDRVGEFGTFGETTGAAGVRLDPRGEVRGRALRLAMLSPSLRDVDDRGIVVKSGYCFRILLPGHGGGAVSEGRGEAPLTAPVDPDAAERHWCAYAWPVAKWGTDRRTRDHVGAFFVDQTGIVRRTWNRDYRYVGREGGPAWDAAMPPVAGAAWAEVDPQIRSHRGRDGSEWEAVD